ncbi:hypothetical protein PR202_gb13395 [Eleusine coracana subsp. coracana]|uniref:Uncharacterized protein n=1 Tax=Eleusine coracana subsp. coracana TaxID=191504 RepID=A0AAV5ET43_ELECO|nr:hypothetical protein PR202_gb13395 [Eleusine coracana subsp. coracana]
MVSGRIEVSTSYLGRRQALHRHRVAGGDLRDPPLASSPSPRAPARGSAVLMERLRTVRVRLQPLSSSTPEEVPGTHPRYADKVL